MGTDFRILFQFGRANKKAPYGCFFIGPPDRIRTYDTRNRNPVLYPAELRADFHFLPLDYIILSPFCKHQYNIFIIYLKFHFIYVILKKECAKGSFYYEQDQ